MAATRTIELKTEVPGPRSREVLARLAESVAPALAITFPVVAADARGALLTDVDGNVFIDFTGGVGCLNVGHSHPQVVAAAQEQLERFAHTDFTVVPYEIYAALGRAAARARAVQRAGQGSVLQRGRRGSRERRQVRPPLHPSSRCNRLRRRVSRAHAARAFTDVEDPSLQGWARAVLVRGLSRPVPECLSRALDCRGALPLCGARS